MSSYLPRDQLEVTASESWIPPSGAFSMTKRQIDGGIFLNRRLQRITLVTKPRLSKNHPHRASTGMILASDPLGSIYVPYLGTFSLPATDAELLKSLQPHEVHRWTLRRIKECEEYLRALRSVHNAAAPIHVALPVEVIMRIFLSIELDNLRDDIAVLHVCRTWRTILLSIPEFFANLLGVVKNIARHDADKNGLLRMLLLLSGACQLTLHRPCLEHLTWYAGPLVPYLGRIRSLTMHLEVMDFAEFHWLLWRGTMPNLADLTVLSHVQDRQSLETELPRLVAWTGNSLPCLRRLELISALFTQASAYPLLESLILKHGEIKDTKLAQSRIPRLKSPTLLLQALKQCSRLRILDLVNVLPAKRSDWDAIIDDDAFVIHFPELCELHVHEDRRRLLSRFLRRITFPPTASLDLKSGDYLFSDVIPICHRELMLDSATALHFIPPAEGTSTHSLIQVYHGTRKSLVIRVESSGELFTYLARLVDDITAIFPSGLSDLGMFCHSRFFVIHTKLLNSFPEVKRLTLYARDSLNGGYVGNSDIINRILTARSGSDWQRFVCPKLETLQVKSLLPPAATLATGLRTALETRTQPRLKTLEVRWPRKFVGGNSAYELPEARKSILEDILAEFVDEVSVDEY